MKPWHYILIGLFIAGVLVGGGFWAGRESAHCPEPEAVYLPGNYDAVDSLKAVLIMERERRVEAEEALARVPRYRNGTYRDSTTERKLDFIRRGK